MGTSGSKIVCEPGSAPLHGTDWLSKPCRMIKVTGDSMELLWVDQDGEPLAATDVFMVHRPTLFNTEEEASRHIAFKIAGRRNTTQA